MTIEAMKQEIDRMSYEELLRHWRFAPVGDPFFSGEAGAYYTERMRTLRSADPEGHVRASKSIGW